MKTNDTAPRICHYTENTGDSQSFSLTDANFDPRTIERVPGMFKQPIAGFSLAKVIGRRRYRRGFVVKFNGHPVSINNWSFAPGGRDIRLSTLIGPPAMAPEFAPMLAMLADLEQCVAVAMAREEQRTLAATTRA